MLACILRSFLGNKEYMKYLFKLYEQMILEDKTKGT